MKNLFKYRSGFSLVEVTVAMALLAIVGVAVFQLSGMSSKDNRFMSLARIAIDQRNKIVMNIKNPIAWQNTSNFNASFTCLAQGATCNLNAAPGSQGYYDFVLIWTDPTTAEKITYQADDPTSRISLASNKCPAGTSVPNKECPLKYRAQWKPICTTYPCSNAQLEIKVDLIHDFPNEVSFNVSKYSIKIIRDYRDSSLEAACAALNGTFNATTGTCTPKYANATCPPNQIISAVNSDGTIVCKSLYSGQCNATTQLVAGINPSGQVQCGVRPTCPSTPSTPTVPSTPYVDTCSATWCHLLNTYSCTRTNGVASSINMVGVSCTDEDSGANPCNKVNCGVLQNCIGTWGACTDTGGGVYKQTYSIYQPAANGGTACSNTAGAQQGCTP